ncbi:unnamed protein product [Prorocentrum cordatum]|uniref:Uncharacterized protein n=1 Tax=Prorocentrum cordatum TaxID=2364126 RepID=A0ABN9P9N8_9DINO|nr:unnamed protein product [Polarella glacialis]
MAPARPAYAAPPQAQDPSYSRGYMDALAAMGRAPLAALPPPSPVPSTSATLPHPPTPGPAPPGPPWGPPAPSQGSALPVFRGLEHQWLQQHHTVATVTPQAVPFPVPVAAPTTQADGAAGAAAPAAAAPAAAAPPDRITYGPYNYRLDVESLPLDSPAASFGERLEGQGWQLEGHQHAAVLAEKRKSRGIC